MHARRYQKTPQRPHDYKVAPDISTCTCTTHWVFDGARYSLTSDLITTELGGSALLFKNPWDLDGMYGPLRGHVKM